MRTGLLGQLGPCQTVCTSTGECHVTGNIRKLCSLRARDNVLQGKLLWKVVLMDIQLKYGLMLKQMSVTNGYGTCNSQAVLV